MLRALRGSLYGTSVASVPPHNDKDGDWTFAVELNEDNDDDDDEDDDVVDADDNDEEETITALASSLRELLYALQKVFLAVGETGASEGMFRVRLVVDFPKVLGTAAVWRDSFGLLDCRGLGGILNNGGLGAGFGGAGDPCKEKDGEVAMPEDDMARSECSLAAADV